MRSLTRTRTLLVTVTALAVAVAVGLTAGLVGGAAVASAFGGGGAGTEVPSAHELTAAAKSLARTTTTAPAATIVAQARRHTIALFRRPGARSYMQLGPLQDSYDTPPVFRVLTRRGAWLHVSLPIRPDHSSAWIRARDVTLAQTGYRLEVQLHSHRLVLWNGRRRVFSAAIAVGKALTPTPSGTYFIAYSLRTTDPRSFFGPYAFGLSAYSNVLTSFAGGDGEIGLHGTSEPWLLGHSVSHGCIRTANATITHLVHLLPLGTPVQIER